MLPVDYLLFLHRPEKAPVAHATPATAYMAELDLTTTDNGNSSRSGRTSCPRISAHSLLAPRAPLSASGW
jgi:hypothetical protein